MIRCLNFLLWFDLLISVYPSDRNPVASYTTPLLISNYNYNICTCRTEKMTASLSCFDVIF